jgi:hypothetical protein
MLAPPNRGSINSTHILGTHVPVKEPSTASIAEVEAAEFCLPREGSDSDLAALHDSPCRIRCYQPHPPEEASASKSCGEEVEVDAEAKGGDKVRKELGTKSDKAGIENGSRYVWA